MMESQQKRILVIEDDPLTSEVIVEALVQSGYLVKAISNPEMAFSSIDEWSPHLVITDHDMPGMSGLDLLCELRKRENYVNVIFVSGRKDSKTIVRALEEGADDFIEKPFRIEELNARVRVSLRANEAYRDLEEKNKRLEEMVDVDDLTGLFNMRSVYDKIDAELARANREGHNVAVIMMDMDRFKSVNDTSDHLFGSFVLKEVGGIVKRNIREYDFAARYGGDEFLICLTKITTKEAVEFCERLRSGVEAYEFDDGNTSMKLTCSIGVSITENNFSIDARNLVREADHALYEAKDAGRNTSVIHEIEEGPTQTAS